MTQVGAIIITCDGQGEIVDTLRELVHASGHSKFEFNLDSKFIDNNSAV